jgi:hypothetical protein
MAKKAVSLRNGRAWGSRGEAISYFRHLRDRQTLNAPIDDPSDHDDLLALLERYDLTITDGPTKIGVGVDRFETRINVTNGGRNVGFWAVRRDGSETDFSFIRAINEAPKRGIEQLSDACRGAVSAELQTAKIRYFTLHGDDQGRVPCSVTGDLIHEHSAALDYVERSFAELIRDFCGSQGWEEGIPRGIISESADAQTTTVFTSANHANAFREFHRAEARIRVVRKRGNFVTLTRATRCLSEEFLEL